MTLNNWSSFQSILFDVFTNYVNLLLMLACTILIYYLFLRKKVKKVVKNTQNLPKMKMRDFTVSELEQYNGIKEPHRLIAVNGNVYNVTDKGDHLYGGNGPYSNFAGKDASRALAKFSNNSRDFKEGFDDLTDLSQDEMNRLKEWELQFKGMYDHVGRLLLPGEPPHQYDDEEEEEYSDSLTNDISKH